MHFFVNKMSKAWDSRKEREMEIQIKTPSSNDQPTIPPPLGFLKSRIPLPVPNPRDSGLLTLKDFRGFCLLPDLTVLPTLSLNLKSQKL